MEICTIVKFKKLLQNLTGKSQLQILLLLHGYFILVSNARGTRTPNITNLLPSPESVYVHNNPNSNTIVIDLNWPIGKCLEHQPTDESYEYPSFNPQKKSGRRKSYLSFMLPDGWKCYKIFRSYDCNAHPSERNGEYIQIFDGAKTELMLNSAAPTGFHERLLNLDIYPNSFQVCDDSDVNKLQSDQECQNNFQLGIVGSSVSKYFNATNGKCVQIPEQMSQRPEAKLFISYDSHATSKIDQWKRAVCLETFSEENCHGEKVRFVVPLESTKWTNGSALLWEYFSSVKHYDGGIGFPIRDINIKSVRRCSFCEEISKDKDKENDKGQNSFHKTTTTPVSYVSIKESQKSEEDFSGMCTAFPNCMSIKSVLEGVSVWRPSIKSCYIFFNSSGTEECRSKFASAEDGVADLALLRSIVKSYPSFLTWTYSELEDCNKTHAMKCPVPMSVRATRIRMLFPDNKEKPVQKIPLLEVVLLGVVGSLAVIMVIVVIVMSILLWRKKRRIRAIRDRCVPGRRFELQPTRALNVHQVDGVEVNDYVNDVTGVGALCATFKDGYEISRDRINIGNMRDSSASIIGVGEFSIAFKGTLEPEGRMVAVKTMKCGQATPRSLKWTLRECQVFKQLGKHPRILEFLGVCTENVRKGELFVVMALCERGSLKGFLAQHKSHFVNLVEDGEWTNDAKMKQALEGSSYIENGPPVKFNTLQLFKWCIEIADAMEFLAVRKIVHVSLSARNVLLDEKFATKISDFHLAKVTGEVIPPSGAFSSMTLTTANKERMVPWRFFAVESLVDDVFSTQSDVWTFAVLIWEVFSLGAVPYPEFTYGSEFTLCIKHGYRLQAPTLATTECYQLMLICWYDAPEKRPSFTKIKYKLVAMTPKRNAPFTRSTFQIVKSLSKSSDLSTT